MLKHGRRVAGLGRTVPASRVLDHQRVAVRHAVRRELHGVGVLLVLPALRPHPLRDLHLAVHLEKHGERVSECFLRVLECYLVYWAIITLFGTIIAAYVYVHIRTVIRRVLTLRGGGGDGNR